MRTFKVIFLYSITVFFITCAEEKFSYPLSRYVPSDISFLILKTTDYSELKEKASENTLLKEMLEEEDYNLNLFDSMQTNFKEVHIAFSKSKLSKKYETTLISRYSNVIFPDSLTMLQMKLKLIKNHEIIETSYANRKIYTSVVDGVFISSTARNILKKIIKQPKDFIQNKVLNRLYENSLKNSHASVFIKNKHSNPLLNHFFKKMPVTKDLFDWLMFDVSLAKNRIAFNGITSNSKKSIQKLFYNTKSLDVKTPKITPNNVDEITSYTFQDTSTFFQNIISQNNKITLSTLNNFLYIDEIGILCDKKKKAVALHAKNIDITLNSLNISKKTSVSFIKDKPASKLLKSAFSIFTGDFTANYVIVIDDFIIFSQTEKFLYKINSYYKNGLTYSNANFYSIISDHMLKSSNILKFSLTKNINKKTYSAFAFQVSNEGEFCFTNAILQNVSAPKSSLGINKVFELTLDNDVSTNPQFFTNHITGKKDIIVQDNGHVLYLIDYSGKIIWKKSLNEKILGKIHEVDLYRNGRVQLAFVTKNSFIILDRNGNIVKPFEMTFSEPVTQPLSVFDYDKNKNYRFVITTKDKIYMYNRQGKIVKGFMYTKHKHPLLFEPKHIRIENKDYIIVAMKGKLKILNRQGKTRIRLKKKIDFSNKFFLYKNTITSSDKKGNLIQINKKGKIKKTKLPVRPNHYIEASEKSLFTLSDYTLTIKGNPVKLEKGEYTSPKMFYINDVIYVCTTNLSTNKVYIYYSNGKLLEHFPIKGSSVIDLSDIDKDRQLELIVKSDDNSINLYKIRSPL